MIIQSRRRFLTGLVSALAAPAIVRFDSLMPVKALPPDLTLHGVPIYFDDPDMAALLVLRMNAAYWVMAEGLSQSLYGDHPPLAGTWVSLLGDPS